MSSIVPRAKPTPHQDRRRDRYINQLLSERRFCYHIEPSDYEADKGYRVSIVIENEPGRFPTGYNGVEPWYWGHDLAEAQAICAADNERKLELTPIEVMKIITSSMFKPTRKLKKPKK